MCRRRGHPAALARGRRQAPAPEEDFWIFDSRLVARLNFDDADDLVNVELITEPVEVNRYAQVRDAAWHYAIPYERSRRTCPRPSSSERNR